MRPTLLEILACPVCKNSLRLEVSSENDTEILE
ncbi:MAG: Trm112 family protein, partial [Dehalococcoidia bacterium]|nr:Trm112 family protein [Dehalococcoidia bacterium]